MVKLRTAFKQYEQEFFWLAVSTKATTKRAFELLATCVGNIRIDRLAYPDCNRYKGWLLKQGLSKTSANIYLRALGPVLKWAVRTNLAGANPLIGVAQFKITRKPVRIYTDDQFQRMLRYTRNPQWKAILLCAWTTGLRRGAVLNLTHQNVRDGLVHVEPKRETARTWLWEPKDKELRCVPLVDELADALNQLKDNYYPMITPQRYENILRLKRAGVLSDWVRRCPNPNFRRDFVGLQRRVFGKQIGDFHTFRKTYTTRMCNQLPPHDVMELTGHSNLKTMTYYLTARESLLADARKIASEGIKPGLAGCDPQLGSIQAEPRQWAVQDLNL